MDHLTPEEEYDLQYMDDLDALNEIESNTDYSSFYDLENVYSSFDKSQKYLSEDNIIDSTSATVSSQSNLKRSYVNVEIDTLDNSPIKKKAKSCENGDVSSILINSNEEDLNSDFENSDVPDLNSNLERSNVKDLNSVSHLQSFVRFSENSKSVPFPLTKCDGTVLYLDMYEDNDDLEIVTFSKRSCKLLSTSVTDLKMKLYRQESLQQQIDNTCEVQKVKKHSLDKCDLWVEKYKPKSYMELLSDEGINRVLLQWLKLWDKVVFGHEPPAKKIKFESQKKNKKFSQFQKTVTELNKELDAHNRPMQKIVLLSGPPGLGKTTLAAIIAKHAGYNIVELNASDDRSPDIFRRHIESSTQMKSVVDPNNRPNCLIIDEIDGAPAASINLLVSFAKSTVANNAKRKKNEIPLLMRPIICICNDQYVPALKPLRQIALILNFPPTSKERLASRLNEIAKAEGIKTSLSALTLLCEKADNDIRSCLSTLQFMCTYKKEIGACDVLKAEIGQKDMHKNLFSVWHDIFYVPRADLWKSAFESSKTYSTRNDDVLKKRFSNALKIVQAAGDYDKLFIGLFENYPKIKFKMMNMDILFKGPDWMCFGDIIQQQMFQNQLFLLMPYLPYIGVAFHLFYAAAINPYLSFPSSYYECRTKRTQSLNILSSMMNDVVASAKSFFTTDCLILEIVPNLVEIIKANIRPINTQLYSDFEKSELKRVVSVMITFSLVYRQARLPDGTYQYVLEPNIEELVQFSGIKTRKELMYATKQLIAHEITLEKLRRTALKPASNVIQISEKSDVQKRYIKPIKTQKPQLDFFGRKYEAPVKKNDTEEPKSIKPPSKVFSHVWYHFKEGFSNAVKIPVKVKDFL